MSALPPSQNDELLCHFLDAGDAEEEVRLEELLQKVQPLLYAVVYRKASSMGTSGDLEDDLISAINLRVMENLRRCKQSFLEGDSSLVIRHFSGLCRTIAISVANEYLRLKYPQRTSLQNQLWYVIHNTKDENKQLLFAWWHEVEEWICGFRAWEGRELVPSSLHHLLEINPRLAGEQVVPSGDAKQQPLNHILSSMFRWLGGPVAFDSVVQAVMCWRGIEEHSEISIFQPSEEDGFMAFELETPDPSPEEKILLKEHLQQLWQGITKLPPKQCAALLLNLCDAQGRGVLGFLPALGIATFAQIAGAMDMELHQFAALWPRLPLEDREIAALYDCGTSSVSVWRARARTRLLQYVKELSL